MLFVAYYRVSTARQGQSGLGLEAQQAAVTALATRMGGELIASFKEIESGRRRDRPQLLAALDLCQQRKATLVIAKLDRLARNRDGYQVTLLFIDAAEDDEEDELEESWTPRFRRR